jgi:hypothetical protein
LLASLSTAQAADLNLESQSPAVSSEADQSGGQVGPGGNAFLPPNGGGGQSGSKPMHHAAVGVKVSVLLGIGIEGAVAVTQKTNVRGGFNFFNYSLTETQSGFTVDAKLHLKSADVLYDWFPFGNGFHLSPGVLIYNGNRVTANLTTPPGTTFTLNDTKYTSSASNPVTGTATADLYNYKVAPMFLFGFGNLIPRSGRHFAVNFETGVAVTGSPKLALNLAGTACTASGGCVNAATDPNVQANVQSTQKKANNDVAFLKAFPVISMGFGYSF